MSNAYKNKPSWAFYWIVAILGFGMLGKCQGQTTTNQVISKPVAVVQDQAGGIWHVHQAYDLENHPVTVRLHPNGWLIGTVISAVHLPYGIESPYREAMLGEQEETVLIVGQKWPDKVEPVKWAKPISRLQDGKELYRISMSDGSMEILLWDSVYALKQDQVVFVKWCGTNSHYYTADKPSLPYTTQAIVRDKDWINPITKVR